MKTIGIFAVTLFLVFAALSSCANRATPTPELATITAAFDMGGGGAGFAAIIYAQEVTTGKTFRGLYPAGSHGGVVMPTSPPITFSVEAPGTYVFYAILNEAPSDYHYGATGCKAGEDCESSELIAVDVVPGGNYQVYIGDRSAEIPFPGEKVTVPWRR